jgi:hypothetical protein
MMSANLHDHLRQVLSEAQISERGRELGADFAKLGMHPPEDSPTSVHEGFAAAAYRGFRHSTDFSASGCSCEWVRCGAIGSCRRS